MNNTTKRGEFLAAVKNVDAVIWPLYDLFSPEARKAGGHCWKAVTSKGIYATHYLHGELVAELERKGMTWINGVYFM